MQNLPTNIFNIDIATPPPGRGKLLVAEPFMVDNYFGHAVVLMLDCEPRRKAMGLVLNRMTDHTLGSLIEGFDDEVDIPVFLGGPVSTDRLFYIHRLGDVIDGAMEIFPGLWVGGDFEQVKEYVADGQPTDGLIRFYAGYSGWDEQQLEGEIAEHTWAVTNPMTPRRLLTGHEDAYWHKVVRSMGPSYAHWLLHPMYPSAN